MIHPEVVFFRSLRLESRVIIIIVIIIKRIYLYTVQQYREVTMRAPHTALIEHVTVTV